MPCKTLPLANAMHLITTTVLATYAYVDSHTKKALIDRIRSIEQELANLRP